MAGRDDAEIRQLAERLARAERAVAEREQARFVRPGVLAVAAAQGLAVIGLLLPWSRDDGAVRDAFTHSAALVVIALLTAAGAGVALALHAAAPSRARAATIRAITVVGGVLGMLIGLAVNGHIDADERQWWGLGLFEIATLAAMLLTRLTSRENERDTRLQVADASSLRAALAPHLRAGYARVGLAVLGVSGLALAAAGLTSSWQRMTGHVVTVLAGHPLVWRGTELESTQALRWAVAAGLAACLVAVALHPLRVLLPGLLTAAGAVVIGLTISDTSGVAVQGTNAAISVGPGAWLTLSGGIVAAACGLALGWASLRSGGAIAAASAVLLAAALVAEPAPGRAGADPARGTPVLGASSEYDERLGASAATAVYDQYDPPSFPNDSVVESPVIARSLDGTPATWFVRSLDDDTLIEEIVHGRTLPVTQITGAAEEVDLLGVSGGRAILFCHGFDTEFVAVVDLHEASSDVTARASDDADPGLPVTVLTATGYDDQRSRPGVVHADDMQVELLADGSVAVTTERQSRAGKTYRVDAQVVRGTRPWTLTSPLPAAGRDTVHGPDGVAYDTEPGGIVRTGMDGRTHPVLGGVSDRRCALSRDPLSSAMPNGTYPGMAGATAVDRAGNLWLAMGPYLPEGRSDLYVLTVDGVLRRLAASWHGAGGLRLAGDGSLFVTFSRGHKYTDGPTYRIADPPATARTAAPLPPVAAGCVSDNRVTVTTAGRRATLVGTVPPPAGDFDRTVVVDAAGTTLVAASSENAKTSRWTLRREDRTVYSTGATIADLQPDGHGGAWWLESGERAEDAVKGPVAIGHVDPAGVARIVTRHVLPTNGQNDAQLVADPSDTSAWWTLGDSSQWRRTTLDGHTTTLRYDGAADVLGGGTGYTNDGQVIYRVTRNRSGAAVLGSEFGRGLRLPSALASHAARRDYSTDGELAVTSEGMLLLYQGDYLARFGPHGAPQILSGPKDGLPQQGAVRSMSVVADTLVITTYAGKIDTVRVS